MDLADPCRFLWYQMFNELLQLARDQSPKAPIRTAHEKRAASQDTANGNANELTWRRN